LIEGEIMTLQFIKLYGITLIVFFLIDITWLAVVAPRLYQSQIGHLMSSTVNVPAAAIFYLLFIIGMVYFAIQPSIIANSPWQALLVGAFFGLITYATYDLTNLATLKDWPILITIIDMTWGTTLSALTSIVVFFVARFLNI
jgi:uncharacterized membrane protein